MTAEPITRRAVQDEGQYGSLGRGPRHRCAHIGCTRQARLALTLPCTRPGAVLYACDDDHAAQIAKRHRRHKANRCA